MSTEKRELVLNLRRYQARFLQLLADTADLDRSAACECLIDLEARGDTDNPLQDSGLREQLRSFARGSGERAWSRVTVQISLEHAQLLDEFASRTGATDSRAMRHLLESFIDKSGGAQPATGKKSSSKTERHRKRHRKRHTGDAFSQPSWTGIVIACLLLVLVGIVYYALRNEMSVDVGPHWAGNEASLILDPHTHTVFSDGALTPTELVQLSIDNGCDALVVSDHSNAEGTVSDEQLLEMQMLREQFPDFLLFNGIELNIPSYGGREHATLIADPLVQDETLQRLRDTAERSLKRVRNVGANNTSDRKLLRLVAEHQSLQNGLLLMYSHPTRKDSDIEENLADLEKWNAQAPVFTLLEGAPGHQNAEVTGSYEAPYFTVDGWDPVVAEVGGIWDQWLGSGRILWAALASSDYHNDNLDKAPCAFARTHLVVPEQSYRGVTMALRSGTFWADHGRILNQLWLSLSVEGLQERAFPGYTVYLGERGLQGNIAVEVERGPGSLGQPLTVELIGNCLSGHSEILEAVDIEPQATRVSSKVELEAAGLDGKSCVLRARVRLERDSAVDYLAYTNPIRLVFER